MPGRRRAAGHLHEPPDAGMYECAVANEVDDRTRLVQPERVTQTETDADAGAHADTRVHRLEGPRHRERVAADVACYDAVQLVKCLKHGTMRAPLA